MALIVDDLEVMDWFVRMKGISVNLWITDPPYPFNSQNGTNRYSGMYQRFTWCKLELVYKEMFDLTSNGGRAYIFSNRDNLVKTIEVLEKVGFSMDGEFLSARVKNGQRVDVKHYGIVNPRKQ